MLSRINKRINNLTLAVITAFTFGCADDCSQLEDSFKRCEEVPYKTSSKSGGYVYCQGNEDLYCCCKTIDDNENENSYDYEDNTEEDIINNENNTENNMINDEQTGIGIIVEELVKRDYGYEINSNGQYGITIHPSGAPSIVLDPDIRFKHESSNDVSNSYNYFEFNSLEDPGKNFTNNFPFYREIQPDSELNIRKQVNDYLDNQI
mgnify:FL=1